MVSDMKNYIFNHILLSKDHHLIDSNFSNIMNTIILTPQVLEREDIVVEVVAINNEVSIITIQIRKTIVEYILFDRGSSVNLIIIEEQV